MLAVGSCDFESRVGQAARGNDMLLKQLHNQNELGTSAERFEKGQGRPKLTRLWWSAWRRSTAPSASSFCPCCRRPKTRRYDS